MSFVWSQGPQEIEWLVFTLAKDSPDAALVTELTGGWWDGAFIVIAFGPTATGVT